MLVQVILEIGQYHLSKEEAVDLMNQQVNVVTTIQELFRSTQNLVQVPGDYLRD